MTRIILIIIIIIIIIIIPVRTFCSLRNVGFNAVDDLSKVDVANEIFDECMQRQCTATPNTSFVYFFNACNGNALQHQTQVLFISSMHATAMHCNSKHKFCLFLQCMQWQCTATANTSFV